MSDEAVVSAIESIGRRAAQDNMRLASGASLASWLYGQANPYRTVPSGPECCICRRLEVEHRDRNGHGFVAVEGEPPHRAAWSGNWRDEDNAPGDQWRNEQRGLPPNAPSGWEKHTPLPQADDTPPDTRSEVET